MPLETGNTISQLDDRYPLASDPGSRGDDHFRLIKGILKKQFPGEDGNGFKVPITLTEKFLNDLPSMIEDLQTAMDNRWPVGAWIFLSTNQNPNTNNVYPGVWQLITGDASIALGDGTNNVGTINGNNTPNVPVPKHNHVATFTGNQLPPHSHDIGLYGNTVGPTNRRAPAVSNNEGLLYTSNVSAGTPSGYVNVDYFGTENATLNVRGAQIKVNVWKRVS